MSNPKARSSQPQEQNTSKLDDTTRFLNLGIPVTLSFGEYNVRELDVVTLGQLAANGLDILVQMQQQDENKEQSDFALIQKILMSPDGRKTLAKVFAAYCDSEDTEPFEKLRPKDFNTLWKAVKEVTDFEQIKETFFVLGLQNFLPIIPTSTENEETQVAQA